MEKEIFRIGQSKISEITKILSEISLKEKKMLEKSFNIEEVLRKVETCAYSLTIRESRENEIFEEYLGFLIIDYNTEDFISQEGNIWQSLEKKSNNRIRPFNTLFLDMLVFKNLEDNLNEEEKNAKRVLVFRELMKYLFKNIDELEYLVYYPKNNYYKKTDLANIIDDVRFFKEIENFKVLEKRNILNCLKIRKATEEDQDNLCEICNQQTELKSEIFGDFFLAEIISSKSDDKICLVAENEDNKVVGILVASDKADYEIIMKNYDLAKFNYFTKEDFFLNYQEKKNAQQKFKIIEEDLAIKQENDKMAFLKKIYSKKFLILELQEYCVKMKDSIQNEFSFYLNNEEKQKTLKKSVLKTRFDKHLKNHKIEIPDEVFKERNDLEIETCIMSPLDLLFETLEFYDLPVNYLEGEGHWRFWLKRKIEEKKESNKQKDIFGKKKIKMKKRKNENKENEVIIPPNWFDIEPFFVSFTDFINSDIRVRENICNLFINNKQQILQLFVMDNYELKTDRCVDLGKIFDFFNSDLNLNLDDNLIKIIPSILVCFGALDYDSEKVKLYESKNNRKIKKTKEKILKKVSFQELYEAIDKIRESNHLLKNKNNYLTDLQQKYQQQFEELKKEIFENCSKKMNCDNFTRFEENYDYEKNFYRVPQKIQNIICINMFFIDEDYKNSSLEFIPKIFQYFKNKDYLIMTMPHNSPEINLLKNFMLAPLKKNSNFSHCLYFFNRVNILNKFIKVNFSQRKTEFLNKYKNKHELSDTEILFTVDIDIPDGEVFNIGHVIAEKNVNLDYLKKNLDLADFLLFGCYQQNEFLELKFLKIDKFFENSTRFVLREILNLTKTKILFKNKKNYELDFLHNFFTILKPLEIRKLKKEKKIEEPEARISALSIKSLIFWKKKINSRIFVIGASKTSIGFLDYLLKDPNYIFTNLTLISSSFSWKKDFIKTKLSEKNYTKDLIEDILMKVNIIYGTLDTLNRKSKLITFRSMQNKEYIFEYDILILCNSFEEKTYQTLLQKKEYKKIQKPDYLIPIHSINDNLKKITNRIGKNIIINKKFQFYTASQYNCFFQKKNKYFCHEKDFLREIQENLNNPHPCYENLENYKNLLMSEINWFSLLKHPKDPYKLIFYGFSINIFITMKEMIDKWEIQPENIILIVPREINFEKTFFEKNSDKINYDEFLIDYPIAFKKKEIWEFYKQKLLEKKISIYENYEIVDFNKDEIELKNKNLEIKNLASKTKNINLNKMDSIDNILDEIDKYIVILGDTFDISEEIFNTIQDNGLVYNGRLIVQSDFRTIDESIFASGKICEFSQRYKNSSFGRSLRMDKYNQYEVGQSCAQKFLQHMRNSSENSMTDDLPFFKKKIGMKTKLFLDYYYVDIWYPYLGKIDFKNNLEYKILNQLDNQKDYIAFGFDQNQIVKHLIYFGKTNINYVSFKKLMKLHLNHFNFMFKRFENGLIDNFLDFLNQPWAEILYHPYFIKFQKILDQLLEINLNTNNIEDLKQKENWGEKITEMIENSTIDFIKENKQHFLNYLII